MKIKLLEPLAVSEEIIGRMSRTLLEETCEFYYYDTKTTDVEELKERANDADILIIGNNPLPDEVIEEAKNLKMISVAFTGFDHVGKAAKSKDIVVTNAAGYANNAVAELAIGLTLDLLRKITTCNQVVREGGTVKGLIGREIKGKTVGIIGTGRIGTETARLFKAFGAKVIGYNRSEHIDAKEVLEYKSLEEILRESDIISLHLPLNESTKNFISKEKLEMMKPTSILINCARGGIVDNNSLAELLEEGKIAGAGIDVFDMEPPIPEDYPLLKTKNTILTPHVAYATDESMLIRAEIAFDNVLSFLKGEPKNIVNL